MLLTDPQLQSRLKQIRILVLDVDGVLTDGRMFWQEGSGWTRYFHIVDGYGIKLLKAAGIEVAVMSGSDTVDIRKRMEVLNIERAYLGNEDKLRSLALLGTATGLNPAQMAYVGDDLFDIPVLEQVGFAATVPHAVEAVRKRAHYITTAPGGAGAVREIADAIRQAQGLGPYLEGPGPHVK